MSTPTDETTLAEASKLGTVSVPVAQAVLFDQGHYLGQDPGHFEQLLIRTIKASDEANRGKLASLYPEHVVAVEAAVRKTWGLNWLVSIVTREMGATS